MRTAALIASAPLRARQCAAGTACNRKGELGPAHWGHWGPRWGRHDAAVPDSIIGCTVEAVSFENCCFMTRLLAAAAGAFCTNTQVYAANVDAARATVPGSGGTVGALWPFGIGQTGVKRPADGSALLSTMIPLFPQVGTAGLLRALPAHTMRHCQDGKWPD
jgi:hypothetical protein